MFKNPNWTRDELILALDFYFQNNPRQLDVNSHKVTELSNVLKSLPIHLKALKDNKFRNNNAVHLKLSNFLSLDPSYDGKGMSSIGKLDKLIWNEFSKDKEKLSRTATLIKLGTNFINENNQVDFDEDEGFYEGKVLKKIHMYKERNSTVVKKKKELFLKKNGSLFCEICSFDFKHMYGNIGEGFIECHHIKPISKYEEIKTTKLSDLILVCSNCHRILHRDNKITPEKLKSILNKQ